MDFLIKNAVIVTMDANNTVLKNASIGIKGNKISYLGPNDAALSADRVIDGRHLVVMPGLHNTHTHIAMTALRGISDDVTLNDWLFNNIFPAEAKLDSRRVELGARLGMAEAIASGTVSICDAYFHTPFIAKAAKEIGLRANIGNIALALGDDFDRNDRSVTETIELGETYKDDPFITPINGVHSAHTSNPKVWEWVNEINEKYRMPLVMHMSETLADRNTCIERFGQSPTKILNEAGLFKIAPVAAHGVWVDEEDIAILRDKNVSIAHCPISNLKLASGIAPITKFIQAGVNITLGTDSVASNNSMDLFEEIKICALLQKNLNGDASSIKASDVLRFATVNGANALGRGGESGYLAPGRNADFIALDFDKPHLIPCYDVISNLVYAASGKDVCLTVVDGKVLYDNGEYTTIDMEKLKYELRNEIEAFFLNT